MLRVNGSFLFAYIIIEVLLASLYVDRYGFLSLLFEVILTGIFGLMFIIKAGTLNFNLQIKNFGFSDLFGILSSAIAGFFLFLPGLLTDFFGVTLLVVNFFLSLRNQDKRHEYDFKDRKDEDEIIDVEIIDDNHIGK